MSIRKYSFLFVLFVSLISGSCDNQSHSSNNPVSPVISNPAYTGINDSIRQFSTDASLYMRRAVRLTQQNAHELANPDFKKAWTLSGTIDFALPYAANLEILGRRKERLELLETLNDRFPSNAQAGRLLAEAYSNLGKPVQALAVLNNMIGSDSLNTDAQYEKAILLEQLKDTAQAIATLRKIYSIQRVDTYGLELAHLYAEQKNSKALEICDGIIRQDSARVLIDPYFIKGIYYANLKQFPKAIIQFDSCIARDWKTTDAYLEKGRAYFQMKNYKDALKTFEMAITVTNTDPDAYFWAARCFEAQNRKTDAIVSYKKAISLDNDFVEAKQRVEVLEREFAHP